MAGRVRPEGREKVMKKNHIQSIAIVTLAIAVIAAAIACKNPIKDKVEEINASEAPSLSLSVGSATVASGGSYNMGATALATTRTGTFTLSNSGKSDLEASVSASGNFSVASQPAGSIAPGKSSSFVVNFTPTSPEGLKSGTITISSNDPKNESFKFTATGLGSTIMLPKTGQTTSYATGDDGALQKGVAWPNTRFSLGVSTIIDNLAGLEWSKAGNLLNTNFPGLGLDPDATVDDGKVTWQHALDFIAYLNANSFASHADWRLPNRAELRNLLNTEQSDSSTWLASQGFSNVQPDFYWSSTNNHLTSTSAWFVDMSIGQSSYSAKTALYYIWPVRGGNGGTIQLARTGQTTQISPNDDGGLRKGAVWPATRFKADTSSTVTDLLTGLIWEKSPSTTGVSWTAALTTAQTSSTGSYTDWRLPNVNELANLLNAEQGSTADFLNTQGFNNITATAYWTSSSCKAATTQAWTVNFGEGQILYSAPKSGSRYLFLVRSAH
jgi:hypothetical protein